MKNQTLQSTPEFTKHPIHLVSLGVRELFIGSNVTPDATISVEPDSCSITVASTPYDSKGKRILVSLKLEVGRETGKRPEVPYSMRIELIGIFEVDEAQFLVEHVDDWAMRGAPLVLYPYLREHAFGLSSRCGFKPLLLPLVEVPTFKVEKPKKPSKKQTK